MKWAAWVAIGAIWLCTLLALDRLCIVPYRLNQTRKVVESVTRRALEVNGPEAPLVARKSVEQLSPCLAATPDDMDCYMILAANYGIMKRNADAARMYRTALQYDHRPEIYLNLGLTLLDLNQHEAAVSSLVSAVIFNPALINEVPSFEVRNEVETRVETTYPWIGKLPRSY
jgi:hypothetical protein